jgi:hypothetical protein
MHKYDDVTYFELDRPVVGVGFDDSHVFLVIRRHFVVVLESI